ncbi:hypothetical protein MCOR06_005206 [Pyricularia oryzae]|nr:hypothetical protein MCOR06_005206 [Pyricularia oryzae]
MSSFPRLRILKANGKQALVQEIASRICATGLSGLPIARQNEKSRAALLTYLTKVKLTPAEINAVECAQQGGFWSDATKAPFFLFRGIFAGGILAFILARKRWKVNYGLDPMRQPPTRLAVPYRAKDSPSPRSEFSHPKVVLFLTSLSYYYGGLSDEDLFVTFGQLLKSDQPDQEYNAWIADAPNLDSSFHHLEGVNIKDKPQCVQLLSPKLRYAKAVVDYFLGHVVFPKYIKEFPSKLSGSGWDIGQVLLDVGAQILELGNLQVAKQWLRMHQEQGPASNKQAYVYFDNDDNLCVVDIRGKKELRQTSPFATALDICLVFLDEAHIRGTDLKLPDNFRAAVTLGANLVKDRLV